MRVSQAIMSPKPIADVVRVIVWEEINHIKSETKTGAMVSSLQQCLTLVAFPPFNNNLLLLTEHIILEIGFVAQFKACMEFFPSVDKSVFISPTVCTCSRAGAACRKIRAVQEVQAAQHPSPCTVEAIAYPASSEFPMWPQNMEVVKLRRKFKSRDSSCSNKNGLVNNCVWWGIKVQATSKWSPRLLTSGPVSRRTLWSSSTYSSGSQRPMQVRPIHPQPGAVPSPMPPSLFLAAGSPAAGPAPTPGHTGSGQVGFSIQPARRKIAGDGETGARLRDSGWREGGMEEGREGRSGGKAKRGDSAGPEQHPSEVLDWMVVWLEGALGCTEKQRVEGKNQRTEISSARDKGQVLNNQEEDCG